LVVQNARVVFAYVPAAHPPLLSTDSPGRAPPKHALLPARARRLRAP
jgi:hypothetical protein